MFGSLDISTSGLVAQRIRMDTLAGNIANAGVRGYQRRVPLFASSADPDNDTAPGVRVAQIAIDTRPGHMKYDPGHPFANADGMVEISNVSVMNEMINAIEAARAYDANITMINATKTMAEAALRLIA